MNLRNGAKRIVQIAWLVTLGAWVFCAFHAGDRDPLQWPSAMFATAVMFSAMALTLIYLVIVWAKPPS